MTDWATVVEYTRIRPLYARTWQARECEDDPSEDYVRYVGWTPWDSANERVEYVEINGHPIRGRIWRRSADGRWRPEAWRDAPGATA